MEHVHELPLRQNLLGSNHTFAARYYLLYLNGYPEEKHSNSH